MFDIYSLCSVYTRESDDGVDDDIVVTGGKDVGR